MKKHTVRRSRRSLLDSSSERDFADKLTLGERFAISEGTSFPYIAKRLAERDMRATQVDLSSLSREEQRHWAVYVVKAGKPA